MSFLKKEDLILLKEQFKSTHNVLPSRFKDLDGEDLNTIKIERTRHQSVVMSGDYGTYKNIKDIKRGQTQQFKLPGADEKAKKNPIGREMRNDLDKNDNASSRINNIKKYNYTKNSLNCIPLSNKFRQWFIRFVEWKHQSNLVLVFVAINSIILGIVDYRFKGKYTDANAPTGNYLLGITEPIFAVLFTLEALIKIIAQGFILSKKTYLRDEWNVLDFIVVITALMSFSPDISSVSILRAFRLFKPLRNLQVFPSMRLLMRTLIASANRLRFLVILYFFVIMMFAIIGVNLMQGVTTFRCRQTVFPRAGDWLPVNGDTRSCGWSHSCDTTCGSLYQNQFMINGSLVTLPLGNVTNLDRDSEIKELFFSYATFDNLFRGFLTLFQISTLQNWYKIMYMLQDSYNSYISGIFFVVYLLMTNYFVHILIIGIIMQRFIEFNEHKERQQIYQKILGMDGEGESIKIEELKNMFREDDQINKEIRKQKRKSIKEQVAQLIFDIMSHKGDPLPKGRYFKHGAPKFCWNLNQNIIYELGLALAGLINALALAFLRYPENEANQTSVNVINITVTTMFAIDMLVRLIGQGFYGFITNLENILYTLSTIGGAVHIIYNDGAASPLSAFMALKVYKIVMRSGYYQTFNQLIDSIIFTLAVVMSYCAIMILFIYIFSLLGMQFFAGRLKFAADGSYDPAQGKVPRQNFDTILWSATTVLQIVIGDDWSLVMFNCMLSTGWYSCFYFVALILFGYIILMNLFQAILIGNFEEASLIMRDTKFLKSLQKVAEEPNLEPGNNKVESEQAELFFAKQRKRNTIFMPKIQALALAPNDVEIESKPIPNPSPVTIKQKPTKITPALPPLITIDQFAGGSKKRQETPLLSPKNNNRGSGLETPSESDRLPLANLNSSSRPQSVQSFKTRRDSLNTGNQFLVSPTHKSPNHKRSTFKKNAEQKAKIQNQGSGSGSGEIIDVKIPDQNLQQKATISTGILKSKIPAFPAMLNDSYQIDEQYKEESARSNFSFDEENPGQERGSNTRKKLDLLEIQKMTT